jgi:arsenate reductase
VNEVSEPIRVLFLCVRNSPRSQVAAAFLRRLGGDRFEVASAGSEPAAAVDPLAVRVMARHGLDVSGQRPTHQDAFADQRWEYVVSTCDRAREACPTFPGRPDQVAWRFDDPAEAAGSEEEREQVFWRVSREIDQRVRLFVNATARRPTAPTPIEQQVRELLDGGGAAGAASAG